MSDVHPALHRAGLTGHPGAAPTLSGLEETGCPVDVRRAGRASSGVRSMRLWRCRRPDARSAVKHRPADVVPQPLVVEYELANRLGQLVTLAPAFESPCAVALTFRRAGMCGLDRIPLSPVAIVFAGRRPAQLVLVHNRS